MALTDRIILPLASQDDAKRTTAAVVEVVDDEQPPEAIVPLHIIEKGGGSIDKLSVDAQREQATELFDHAISTLEAAGYTVEPEVVYATDVVDAICDAAIELEATAIMFLPREGGTISKLLSGNRADRLISQAPVPVITLPQPTD